MWKQHDLRISAGFWLLLGWFGLANGWRLLAEILVAAALHELGHCLVMVLTDTKICGLRIGVCGAVLNADTSRLTYGQELAMVLAGPGMNLLCASLLLAWNPEHWTEAAGAHLVLCAFNLLPLRPLDGGRALYLLLAWLTGPETAERTTQITGTVCGVAWGISLSVVMWQTGGSLWLIPAVIGLFCAAEREWRTKGDFL